MSARQFRRARQRDAQRQEKRQKRLGSKSAVGAGVAVGATVLFTPAAEAATFTVTSTADDGSEGTLRKEIQDANANGVDDVITFASGLSGTITLSSADGGSGSDIEIINDGLEIQGPGPGQITVNGAGTDRIFTLYSFNTSDEAVSVSGLTVTGGNPGGGYFGGALYSGPAGGGNAAEVTISSSVLTDNHADGGGGGAVSTAFGSLTVLDSTFTANSAGQFGGALYTAETDGDQATEVVIRNSTISGNQADLGSGGFATYAAAGDVLIEGSTISGNEAATDGGGLGFSTYNGAAVTIQDSTISGNEAGGSGGGIKLAYIDGEVLIQNTTVSGNTAGDFGGGIRNYANSFDTERTIRNSTIVGNTADEGGGIYSYRYDNLGYPGEDNLNLSSTIVANNSAALEGDDLGQYDGIPDTFIVGFSLVEDSSDAEIVESPAGSNLVGVDPQLGPLAANGGPTQTHLPAQSSPAIDKGIANGLANDQHGLVRTGDLPAIANASGGDGTDIGSVELQAADCQGTTTFSITGTGGDDSLSGTAAGDPIFGLAGNDAADGLAGNDCIDGGDGNDTLKGAAGKDLVTGQAGKDKLRGQGGRDKLKGSGGKDNLKGGGGKDKLSGGGGKDKLSGGGGKDKITTGGGKDKVNCGGGKDKVNADAKDEVAANCETVT